MASNSSIGINREKYIYSLTRKIASNRVFLDDEDLKVLEFLSKKGNYENKKAILINKKQQFL